MNLGRFLVDAIVLGGGSHTELARRHPISRSCRRHAGAAVFAVRP